MLPRPIYSLAFTALAALTAACGSTPKPPEPPPAPTPTIEELPPEPPKPKPCEALDEKCDAKDSTKAKIAKSDFVFKPAKGWIYAQGQEATIAQAADDGPAVVVAQFDIDPKQEAANREAALGELSKQINVTLPKKKLNWKKPDDAKAIGDLKLGLWQIDGARGDKKGPLILFAAPVADGKVLLGVGFVPSDDSSGADAAILESIESITGSGAGSGK